RPIPSRPSPASGSSSTLVPYSTLFRSRFPAPYVGRIGWLLGADAGGDVGARAVLVPGPAADGARDAVRDRVRRKDRELGRDDGRDRKSVVEGKGAGLGGGGGREVMAGG